MNKYLECLEELQSIDSQNELVEFMHFNFNTIKEALELASKSNQIERPLDVKPEVWDKFKKMRAEKRTKVTKRVIDNIREECNKIGWTLEQALSECNKRDWRGFKAEWVAKCDKKTIQRSDMYDWAMER